MKATLYALKYHKSPLNGGKGGTFCCILAINILYMYIGVNVILTFKLSDSPTIDP